MPYSDLIVTPVVVSIAATNDSFTVNDNTGTYPESPGGFAPTGEGTATRPEQSGVIQCFMYRFLPFSDPALCRYPSPQPSLPATFSNLSGAADRVIQVVEVVLPDTFNWEEILDDGLLWDDIIDLANSSGAVGQVAVWMNKNEVNCVYDALRRLNNKFPANCNMEEWVTKNAMFIGTAAVISTVIPLPPNEPTTEDLYAEIEAEIAELVALCNDPTCQCNC